MILLTTILLILTTAVPFSIYMKSEKGIKSKKATLISNIGMFFASIVVMTVCMGGKALAAAAVSPASNGMAFLSAGLATAGATIGAGIAVGAAASAALGALSENEGIFGKALIFVALAEGIALYGVLVAVLILNNVA